MLALLSKIKLLVERYLELCKAIIGSLFLTYKNISKKVATLRENSLKDVEILDLLIHTLPNRAEWDDNMLNQHAQIFRTL